MDYREYVRGISFRLYHEKRRPWRFYHPRFMPLDGISPRLHRLDLLLEILNTRLPQNGFAMRKRLASLCEIPRMSTFAIAAMINEGVSRMPEDQCFVNVGVWNGFTLLSGMVGNERKKCVGVDDFSEFGGPRDEFLARFNRHRSPRHEFHEMNYEDYFATVHAGPIGFYIYDGEHSYEHQLRGMKIAEPFFADRCILLVDDTNLPAPRDALFDFVARSENAYEVLLDRRTKGNLHPTLWNGVVILRCLGPKAALNVAADA